MAKQIVLTNVKRGGRNRYTLFIYYTVSGSPSKKRRIVYSSVFCTGLRKRLGLDAILALQRLCCPFPKNCRWYVYIMGKRKTVAAFYYVRGETLYSCPFLTDIDNKIWKKFDYLNIVVIFANRLIQLRSESYASQLF